MSIENPKFETELSRKEVEWEKTALEIEKKATSDFYRIDEGIKETVIAFNIMGLPTTQSCEGHVKEGDWPAPCVRIEAPNKPEERFIGERELAERIKEEFGITPEKERVCCEVGQDKELIQEIHNARPELKAKKGMPEKARRKWWEEKVRLLVEPRLKEYGMPYEEYRQIARDFRAAKEKIEKAIPEAINTGALSGEETPEFIQWRKKNQKLVEKASRFLEEFYQDHQISPDVRLDINESEEGGFDITNKGRGEEPISERLTEEEKKRIAQNLALYQEEMRKFGEFIKRKFFQEQ